MGVFRPQRAVDGGVQCRLQSPDTNAELWPEGVVVWPRAHLEQQVLSDCHDWGLIHFACSFWRQ